MNQKDIIEQEHSYILNTYIRPDFVITHGQGVYLFDKEGKKYLDFVSGIAVNALGYNDSGVVNALIEQSKKLWHCSNLYYTEPQVQLAKLLVKNTFADKVFFANSGTEAIEGAIKFARKWGHQAKSPASNEIIAFKNSFHGRTLGALSTTGQEKFWEHFEPLLPGIKFATYNDPSSVEEQVSLKTCAILLEPIQGESGIIPAEKSFLKKVEKVCRDTNTLLMLDEIQCGLGRTGTFCAYEYYDVKPDIMTLAKPLAGGLPLGAILLSEKVAKYIKPGHHGSTFGGGPLVSKVATFVLEKLLDPDLLLNINRMGLMIKNKLTDLQKKYPIIKEIRARGLMIGIALDTDIQTVIQSCQKQGLLVCKAGQNTIRFVPPLIITEEHVNQALDIFEQALENNHDQKS